MEQTMHRVIIIILIFSSVVGCQSANTTRVSSSFDAETIDRIAIIVQDRQGRGPVSGENRHRLVEDILTQEAFVKGYRVVSRTDLRMILEESEFQRTSGLTTGDAVEIGRMLNVPAILIATFETGQTTTVGARLIDVETAEVLWITNMRGVLPLSSALTLTGDELEEAAKAVGRALPERVDSL